ncbi:MAG: exodeoxyribonuclease VII small subunit [Thermoguttaceae bacterium]
MDKILDGNQPFESISFEEAYQQITEVLADLESGRGSLEDSLSLYEKAVGLVRVCRAKLDDATKRIEILKGVDSSGEPQFETLNDDELRSKEDVAGRQDSSAGASVDPLGNFADVSESDQE